MALESKAIIDETGAKTIELYTISNLTAEQRDAKEDYISLLNENIDLLKKEIYE